MESLRAAGSSTAPESLDDVGRHGMILGKRGQALELGARVGGLVAPRCGAMGAG